MSWFKRITTLDIINAQLEGAERTLLESQLTADHYAAMADGARRTLVRLRAMKVEELKSKVKEVEEISVYGRPSIHAVSKVTA